MTQIYMKLLRKAMSGGLDKLPRDMECEGYVEVFSQEYPGMRSLGFFNVQVRKGTPKEVRCTKHRVFIKCKCCSKFVPAGRLMQHMRANDHEEAAKEYGLHSIRQMREYRRLRRLQQQERAAKAYAAPMPVEVRADASPAVANCM